MGKLLKAKIPNILLPFLFYDSSTCKWCLEVFSEDELQPGTGSFKLNTGLYETFRTRDFKPILLKPHLDRLFQSAKKINLEIIYSRLEIEKMIKMVIHNFHDENQRTRVIVSKETVVIYTTSLNLDKKSIRVSTR